MIISLKIKNVLGISLVELLVACSLGLILIGCLFLFYLRLNNLFRYQNSLSQLQEYGRIATYVFNRQLHAAGYIGCANMANVSLAPLISVPNVFGVPQKLAATMPGLPPNIAAQIKADTDIMLIKKLKPIISDLQNSIPANSQRVTLVNSSLLEDNKHYIFSDCTHLERHKINLIANSGMINIMPPITASFAKHTQLSQLQQEIYFISDTGRKNTYGNPIYALNRYFVNSRYVPHELMEGIEDMKIFYGLLRKDNIYYFPATALTASDWSRIKAVRIHLLLTSTEPVIGGNETYSYLGQSIKANDRLLRREWIITVALRENLH